MSVEIFEPYVPEDEGIPAAQMKVGVLYKLFDSTAETVYTRSLQGNTIWFENGFRVGSYEREGNKYVLAPEGTKVILT